MTVNDVAGVRQTHRHNVARQWINWILAFTTVLGAVAVQVLAMGAVMSTAACNTPNCPKPSGFVYGLLTYGALAIAGLTLVITFLTAKHRRGYLVPLTAWALLVLDIVVLTVTFT
jgi:hypothetical protein